MEADQAPKKDSQNSQGTTAESGDEGTEKNHHEQSSTDDSSSDNMETNGDTSDCMTNDGLEAECRLDPVTGYLEPIHRSAGTRGRSVSEGSSSEDDSTRKEDKRQKMNSPANQGFIIPGVSASPPQFVSLEQIMKAANAVSKMVLAHEIAVNKDFKLEKTELPENSLQKKVKETMRQAFWDVLQTQLDEDPPNYTQAIVLLKEIKEGLISLLLPHHTKMHQAICEVLDIDLITQQTEKGVLDFNYYAQYIISIMAKLCAPVRDEQIRDLMRLGEVVPIFRGILQTIDLMKLDMANFHIRLIRPHLQQQSIEYEKAKFAEFLELHDDGLICTRQWLKRNTDKLSNSHLEMEACAASPKTEVWPNSGHILTTAYMELLQWDKSNEFPETLLLDQGRFLDLGAKVDFIALTAAVMLVTYSTVGSAISGISEFKEQLKSHLNVLLEGNEQIARELKDTMKNVAVQVVKEVNDCLLKHGYLAMSMEKSNVLQGQIEEVADPNHRVRHLVKTRILEFIESVLASSTASPIKIPPGLSSMQQELSRVTGQFLRLVSHNRAVFGDHYADIISSMRKGMYAASECPSATDVTTKILTVLRLDSSTDEPVYEECSQFLRVLIYNSFMSEVKREACVDYGTRGGQKKVDVNVHSLSC